MEQTEQLIIQLGKEPGAYRLMPPPALLLARMGGVIVLYACLLQWVEGFRPDLLSQLARPFFTAEILLLVGVVALSLYASVYLIFPDRYQHANVTFGPVLFTAVFFLLLAVQAFLPADSRMVLPQGPQVHQIKCTLCIAMTSIVPAAALFVLMARGASVSPFAAGGYAVLASSGIGCLTLRLSEANDSLVHLVFAHYLPTFIFALLGAALGKLLLRW